MHWWAVKCEPGYERDWVHQGVVFKESWVHLLFFLRGVHGTAGGTGIAVAHLVPFPRGIDLSPVAHL